MQSVATEVNSMPVTCYLDSVLCGQIDLEVINRYGTEISSASGSIALSGLSQGEHQIDIKGKSIGSWVPLPDGFEVDLPSVSVSFFVDLGVVPGVSVSGLNQYTVSTATLNITTDCSEATVCYCLDGLDNVTLPQEQAITVSEGYQYNVTLSDLSDGEHTLTAYAMDSFGNTGAVSHSFTVNTATPTPTAAPTEHSQPIPPLAWIAGASIAAVVIVALVLLLIYRKHKH
jgi:hypothetical protein